MNSTFTNQPNAPVDFDQALRALRVRQDEILQAIGDRSVEITAGLMDELAGIDLVLGVYPLEEVFHGS